MGMNLFTSVQETRCRTIPHNLQAPSCNQGQKIFLRPFPKLAQCQLMYVLGQVS